MAASPRGHQLSRRHFVQGAGIAGLGLLAGCALPQPLARTPSLRRIGVLTLTPGSETERSAATVEFAQALRERGYVEGQHVSITYRSAQGHPDRLPALAAELVQMPVDVLVTVPTQPTIVAQQMTTTIPIVFTGVSDPVATGLVASLARPGGNATGVSTLARGMAGKRLELLADIVPSLTRLAVLWNAGNPADNVELQELQEAAATLGIQVAPVAVRSTDDLNGALDTIARKQADALFLITDPIFAPPYLAPVTDFALTQRLPSSYTFRAFADTGGLATYGPSAIGVARRAAYYVDRILKGAQPADLPVEQPTQFDFVINLKTARALDLTIPQHVLLQATDLVQ
ncbi:MAG TPA: ABC transporter substrate-binding protein [Chloroflexota bacterium]|jgi:putative ABC transport system substrate-binding protein